MSVGRHVPVLLDQVVVALRPDRGGVIVDATFGRGGYTLALVEAGASRVIGIDRDPDAVARAEVIIPPAAMVLLGRFGELDELTARLGIAGVDGVVFDLGVSSPQLDDFDRGFSFRGDGPLDMRMSRDGRSAAELVNSLGETELADVLHLLGEERQARRVARAIVAARREAPIERTATLARIVRGVVPASRDGIDPATRTFQALRILVNDELGELARGLSAAERLLRDGGRLAVVSFHSLEDRIVKSFLRHRSGAVPAVSRHRPAPLPTAAASFRVASSRPITADPAEIARNPRARSAKLRVAERTGAPAWPTPSADDLAWRKLAA